MRIEHGQRVDEVGRGDQRRHRGREQDDDRHRDDGGDGLERLALVLVGQPVDEDGNERGGEHAAQHDVVEHVGRGVGQVVRVGEKVGQVPRPTRRSGAGPVRRETPCRPPRRRPRCAAGGSGPGAGEPRSACPRPRPARPQPRPHPPDQQNGPGQHGQCDADERDGRRMHRQHGVQRVTSWPSGFAGSPRSAGGRPRCGPGR